MENKTKTTQKPAVVGKGPGGGVGLIQKPKDLKNTMRKLGGRLAEYKWMLAFTVLLSVMSALFNVIGPRILGDTTTELFNGVYSGAGINFAKIGKMLAGLLAIYITSTVANSVSGWLTSGVAQKITYKLRDELSKKIHRMPFANFDGQTHGETLSIITNDVDTLAQSLTQSAPQIISSAISVTGIFIMMFTLNVWMALITILLLPAATGFVTLSIKISQKFFKRQQQYLGHVNGQIEEVFGAQTIVRAFNAEKRMTEEFEENNENLRKYGWRAQFVSGLMMPIMMFFGNLGYVANAIIGGIFVYKGFITVGNIQSFIQYSNQLSQPMGMLAQAFGILQSAAAAAERVFNFLEQPEETEASDVTDDTAEKLSGNVTFEHVHFGYSPDKIIVNDFSAHVKDGQKIAIVGPTGAGKTTVIKLLMRFYDVTSGAILVDGVDIRRFRRQNIRQAFGMVLQDTWLYSGSVLENIRYGRPSATDEEVYEAAKAAHIHHFIKALPDGYSMVLSEDAGNISGGQKQLMTIARAILADPKILILDEATSSVDTRTEERIQNAMDNLMHGRTSFIIAHRLSTIQNADLILVMKDGDIIEQGNHDELIAAKGFYEGLYSAQFT